MKKILIVNHTANIGGGELSLLDIADDLKNHSDLLLLATGDFEQYLADRGIQPKVFDISQKLIDLKRDASFFKSIKALSRFPKLLLDLRSIVNNYEVIYCNSLKGFVLIALATLGLKKKLYFHLRDALEKRHISPHIAKLTTFLTRLKKANVFANSEYTKRCFVESGGSALACRTIYNGIDPVKFSKIPQLDQLSSPLKVVMIGRISPWKGQHIFLQALAGTDIQARIVGSANFGENDYQDSLYHLQQELCLGQQVEFFPFANDICQHLSWCDIVVHCSTAPEPFGRVLVEGMMAGRVVVASAAGGALEIIRSGENGYLVALDDSQALRKQLLAIKNDSEHNVKLAEIGRKIALENYSKRKLLENIRQEFRAVIS